MSTGEGSVDCADVFWIKLKKVERMNRVESVSKPQTWTVALLLAALVAGCGGGGSGTVTPTHVPTVSYTIPLDLATAVPTNRKVVAAFSEIMDAATITAPGTFTVKETLAPGTSVTGTVTYDSSSHLATFTPSSALAISTGYTATISTAAKNVAGIALATSYTWSFTTGTVTDTTAPLLLSTDPKNAAINVPVNQVISASFSEPMDPTTICGPAGLTAACPVATFTVTCGGPCVTPTGVVTYSGTMASFTPNTALAVNTTYTAQIAGNDLAGNAWVAGPGNVPNSWTFTTSATGAVHLGPAPVALGATQPYGVLSNTGVTLGGGGITGNRVTGFGAGTGDVGIFPAGACVGCTVGPAQAINGLLENGTVPASDALVALAAAYNDAINRAASVCTLIGSGILTTNPSVACGGTANGTFTPGLYWSGTSIAIPAGGTITLDAQNDPTAVFIFQSESTINSIGGNTHMILANQAQAKNVFWVAKSSATIGGTTSDFSGTVIALIAVTVNTGTTMNGRALARGAEVTVQDGATIIVPAP
jgi:hypothetical protein